MRRPATRPPLLTPCARFTSVDDVQRDAVAQPLFKIELLPDAARDALFALLRRDEAARACCVSRAWRAAFSGVAAAHLWADITFDEASFGELSVETSSVVLGAAAKAGAALRSLSALPDRHVSLLPSLARAHPGLRCVRLAKPSPRPYLFIRDGKGAWLAAPCPSYTCIWLMTTRCSAARMSCSFCATLLCACIPLSPWFPTGRPVPMGLLLQRLSAALQSHAATLRELHVQYSGTPAGLCVEGTTLLLPWRAARSLSSFACRDCSPPQLLTSSQRPRRVAAVRCKGSACAIATCCATPTL